MKLLKSKKTLLSGPTFLGVKTYASKHVLVDILAILFLGFVIVGITYFFLRPKGAEAAWFNDNWAYRTLIPVTNNTTVENNVYIVVTITDTDDLVSAGKLQSDCGDFRFTNFGGDLFDYYISSGCNSASTVIHVLLPTFPAGAQTLYYYYGNPSASNGSLASGFSTLASNYTVGALGSEEKSPTPVIYFKLDEGQGTTIADSSSNRNDATASGTLWQTEDMCVSGKCLYFDGNKDFVRRADTPTIDFANSDNFTIEAWIKASNRWLFKQPITITYSGSALTDYQVKVTVDTQTLYNNGKIQSDCDDIRFFDTDSTSNQELAYWIESGCNTTTTKIWVKVPSISANKTIYMYYGNPDATAASNGDNTFDFFDDFNGTSLDSTKWNDWDPDSWASYSISGGILTYTMPANTTKKQRGIISKNTFSFDNHIIEVKNKWDFSLAFSTYHDYATYRTFVSDLGNPTHICNLDTFVGQGNQFIWGYMRYRGLFGSYTHGFQFGRCLDGDDDFPSNNSTNLDAPSSYEWNQEKWYSTNTHDYNRSTDDTSYSDLWAGTDSTLTLPGSFYYGTFVQYFNASGSNTQYYYVDWMRFRKYSSTEPTTSPGSESPVTNSGNYTILDKFESVGSDGGYKLFMDSSGNIIFGVSDTNTGFPTDSVTSSGTNFYDGKWHQVIGIKNSTTNLQLYIDGRLSGTDSSITTSGTLANNDALYVGISGDELSNAFTGFIDEIKIYGYSLSAAQVKSDYNSRSVVKGTSVRMGFPENDFLYQGLIGYWKTDESSGNSADSSGYGLTLTNNSSMAFASGKFGNAAQCDGTADYLNTATPISGIKTVSFWVNPNNTTNYYLNLINSSAYVTSTSGTVSATGFTLPSVYVNGVLNGTISANVWSLVTVTSNTGINANAFAVGITNDGSNHFCTNTSKIDEVRLYNRAFSPDEVSQLYEWAQGPVGEWGMDEKSGITAFDNSGLGNNLTLTNSPSYANGKFGSAIEFAGSNQHLIRADDDDFDFAAGAGFTLETWFRHNTASAQEVIMSKFNEAGYKLLMESDGDITCGLDYDSTWTPAESVTSTAATYDDNNWHQIACVKNGNTSLTLYIDGVSVGTPATSLTNSTLANSDSIYLGIDADGTSNDWVGQIDEAKIYNYPRIQKQIIEDMNAGHPFGGSPIGSQVGYWKLNEGYGATAYDSGQAGMTGDGNDLTLSSASWTTAGKFDHAFQGASNTRLTKTDDTDFDFVTADDLTLSVWFKRDTVSAQEELIHKQQTATTYEGYALYMDSDGDIVFGIGDTNSVSFPEETIGGSLSKNYDDNLWHQAVAVKSGTSAIKLYVDGKEIASDTSLAVDSTLASDGKLIIGDANETDGTDEFLGIIDELKIYRAAMTAEQVTVDYNQGKSLVLGALSTTSAGVPDNSASGQFCVPGSSDACTAPIGEWKFEQKTGTTVYDSSGNGYDSTAFSGDTKWAVGKIGSGLSFDGVGDSVTISDQNAFSVGTTNQLTVEAWVKPVNISSFQDLVVKQQVGSNEWKLYISSGTAGATIGNTGDGTYLNTSANISANQWYHLTFTANVTTNVLYFYVNGILSGSDTTTAGILTGNTAVALKFAENAGGANNYNGKIDDVKIYNYVRTPAQIAWDYNKGKPVAYWKLDECQGSAINSSSDVNYSGTITIGASGEDTLGTCTTSSTAWGSGVNGKYNSSLSFDGSDDKVTINTAIPTVQTVTFWVKPTTTSDSFMDLDGGTHYITSSSGTVSATGFSIPTIYVNGASDGAITANAWNHVAVTTATSLATTTSFTLGYKSAASADYLAGQLDEVKIYNYALNSTQIQNDYNQGAAVRYGPITGVPQ